jgi:hypothetical protein
MPKPWPVFPVACAGFLLLGLTLAACGSMQSTPQQEATWEIMRACDHFPGVWVDRVDADGKYWVKQNNEGNWRLFQQCVAQSRLESSKGQYAKAEPKDAVYRAYFVKSPPPTGLLAQLPPAVTEFKVDQPVIFFLNIYRSGVDRVGRFKWYRPDGTSEAEQVRTLSEGTSATTRVWYTQILPSASVQVPGEWSLEVTIDNQVVGRYPFTVSR